MPFPQNFYDEPATFLKHYVSRVEAAVKTVDPAALSKAIELIRDTAERGAFIFVCGNGGSAAIANHMVCDFVKGTRADTDLTLRVHSLSTNAPIITAVANDLSYEEVFRYQLAALARPGDMLLTVSSSGDSRNIVSAIGWARENEMPIIALTGFSGGRSRQQADIALHVNADNYGVVEDVHHMLMHCLTQFLRMSRMDEGLVATRTF